MIVRGQICRDPRPGTVDEHSRSDRLVVAGQNRRILDLQLDDVERGNRGSRGDPCRREAKRAERDRGGDQRAEEACQSASPFSTRCGSTTSIAVVCFATTSAKPPVAMTRASSPIARRMRAIRPSV